MSALSAAAHATGTLDDAVSANAVAEPLAARPVIRDVKIGKLPAASRDEDPSDSQLLGKRRTGSGGRGGGAGAGEAGGGGSGGGAEDDGEIEARRQKRDGLVISRLPSDPNFQGSNAASCISPGEEEPRDIPRFS